MKQHISLISKLFDHLPDAVMLIDSETSELSYFNASAYKKLGYTKKEFRKLKLRDIFYKDTKKAEGEKILIKSLFLNRRCKDFTIYQKRKNDKLVETAVILRSIKQYGHDYVLCICHVTEPLKISDDMHCQSRQDWEDIFDTLSDAVTIHDKDFKIIRANKSAVKLLGLNMKGKEKLKCFKYYHGTDKPPDGCPSCNCLQTGKPMESEFFEDHLNKFLEVRAIPRIGYNGRITGLIHIVRDISKRKRIEEELIKSREDLTLQSTSLLEANTAMKVLLGQRGAEKKELEEKILRNINMVIVPFIEKLKQENLSPESLNYVNILESNLNNIISSFSLRMSSCHVGLTPQEIQVARLVRDGRQSKDIADILNISFETVSCHRQNIRGKLDLRNKKINLRTHLLSLQE